VVRLGSTGRHVDDDIEINGARGGLQSVPTTPVLIGLLHPPNRGRGGGLQREEGPLDHHQPAPALPCSAFSVPHSLHHHRRPLVATLRSPPRRAPHSPRFAARSTASHRMPIKPGEQKAAYHRPQSPTQTPAPFHYSPTRPLHSTSNTPAPLPLHHSNYNSHPPPSSAALYPRDTTTSTYYDPTSDYGDRSVGRGTSRHDYDTHYPPQVCTITVSLSTLSFRCTGHGLELTYRPDRRETPTGIQTRERQAAHTKSHFTRP
jgi:hypothetical protein